MSAANPATPAFAEKQHVVATPGTCGGKPRIAGTRIRVSDVATRTHMGHTPEEIVSMYPHLSLGDVYAALAYYFDNKTLIDEQTAEDDRWVEELRKRTGRGPLERAEMEDKLADFPEPRERQGTA